MDIVKETTGSRTGFCIKRLSNTGSRGWRKSHQALDSKSEHREEQDTKGRRDCNRRGTYQQGGGGSWAERSGDSMGYMMCCVTAAVLAASSRDVRQQRCRLQYEGVALTNEISEVECWVGMLVECQVCASETRGQGSRGLLWVIGGQDIIDRDMVHGGQW